MLLELIRNVAMLIALAVFLQMLTRRIERRSVYFGVSSGLLFGIACIIGMMTPLHWVPGVIYDGRSIVLTLAGLFGGPITAVVAVAVSGAYRTYLGGAGVVAGVLTIVESAVLGTILFYLRRRGEVWVGWVRLWVLGVLVHVIMLALQLLIPGRTGWDVLSTIGVPVLAFYPLGFLLTAQMFLDGERKQLADKALRESEEQHRTIIHTAMDGFCLVDIKGRLLQVNESYCRMTGYSEEELMTMSISDLEAVETPNDTAAHIKKIMTEGKDRFESRHRRKGGSVYEVEVTAQYQPFGGGQFVAFIRDITERKVAEEELRQTNNLLGMIVENIPNMIFLKDARELRFVRFNQAGENLLGYSRDDLLGKSDYDFFPREQADFFTEKDREVLRGKKAVDIPEEFLLSVNKGTRTLHTKKVPLLDANGEPEYLLGISEDITERKRAEDALKESEQNYRELVDSLPISVFELDKQGIVTGTNRAALEAFGYSDEDVRNGINAFDTLVPEDHHRAGENLQRVLNGQTTGGIEYTSLRKDGSAFPVIIFSNPIIRDGQVVGLRGAVIDITDRKRAEEAMITANQQLNDIIEFLPDATFVIDLEGKVIAWNRAIEEMTGVSKKDMIGKGDHECTLPFYGERRPHLLDLIGVSNEELESKYHSIQRKGNILSAQTYVPCLYVGKGAHVFATGAPLLDIHGNYAGAIESIRDITEYKEAEAALIESRQQLADIINFLPDATLVIDKYGKVIAWNRAMEAMTGVKAEEMIGKGNQEYSLPFYGERRPILIDLAFHPSQKMEEHYTAIQRRGDIIFGEAYTPSLPSGNVHLSGTASVLRDLKGEIIAAIECIRDNTERKKLEERLRRSEKMEALGTLAGGVAHDLNNVLGILVGYSELLLDKIPKSDPSSRYVTHILQSGQRAAAIIQDLLTLARRGVAVAEVMNLNEVVSEYFKSPEFEKQKDCHPGLTFRTDLEKDLLNIKGSPIHLEKTLINLVSNAAEAISGKGEVLIRTENRYLDEPIRGYDDMREGDYVVLTVSDNGKGISPADLGKIFEPFYTKKVMGRSGTGLGLAVVWGTVKDHDGCIDVQSEEGKGSTFAIYLPVTREELTRDQQKVSPDQYMGKGQSILVVDDVEGQRELAVSMLTRLAYSACAVSCGEDAVAYIKSNKVDLMVLDMIMEPGIDGLETYQRVLDINPDQKAIIVSGYSETDRVRKAQSLGAGAYVKKPYVLEKLGLAVRKELDRPA
jgi:two-component system, cell cycle sensor histidine kinase and response regulator CckA